jgi:hypothetical protein
VTECIAAYLLLELSVDEIMGGARRCLTKFEAKI